MIFFCFWPALWSGDEEDSCTLYVVSGRDLQQAGVGRLETVTGSVNEDIDRTGAVLDTWMMDWILL